MDSPGLDSMCLCLNHMWDCEVSLPSVMQVSPQQNLHTNYQSEMYRRERLGSQGEK